MNASNLLRFAPYEAPDPIDFSLSSAFHLHTDNLKPPFPLDIPSPADYASLCRALAYGVLTEPPKAAAIHFKHLHAIVTDGYHLFTSALSDVAHGLYPKLLDLARKQLLWAVASLIDVEAAGVDQLVVTLLRRINGGDFSEPNLWLSGELLRLLSQKWEWLVEEPNTLTSAVFVFLRLLADHYRLGGDWKLDALKRLEVDFCVRALREKFGFCMGIGRDLIRLLQDLVGIPEFRDIWKDLLFQPNVFGVASYSDISQIYRTSTPARYSLLRVTVEMETQLRFLLTHVKWGSQRRYQEWFGRRYLSRPEQETIIPDLIRFICCVIHPTEEIIRSDVISRWAVIGWLLKCCRKNYFEANAKLALFFDWLFFDEDTDNVMDIEPAISLMVHSIPNYVDMTQSLLEFLFLLVDHYDAARREMILQCVWTVFHASLRKGIVPSLDIFMNCTMISQVLKGRLMALVHRFKGDVAKQKSSPSILEASYDMLHLEKGAKQPTAHSREEGIERQPVLIEKETDSSCLAFGKQEVIKEDPLSDKPDSVEEFTMLGIPEKSSSKTQLPVNNKKVGYDLVKRLLDDLQKSVRQSEESNLRTLEKLIKLFVTSDFQAFDDGVCGGFSLFQQDFCSQILEAFKSTGHEIFRPLPVEEGIDDEVHSATALFIQAYIFYPNERMRNTISFWSKKGYPVGARLLSYVSRLGSEACTLGGLRHANIISPDGSGHPLLQYHFAGHITSQVATPEDSKNVCSAYAVDVNLLSELVGKGFMAYRNFLDFLVRPHSRKGRNQLDVIPELSLHGGSKCSDHSLARLLFSDVVLCIEWDKSRSNELLISIFRYMSDIIASKEEFIQLLMDQMDCANLVSLQFEITMRQCKIFGQNIRNICNIVKRSFTWDVLKQKQLWGLLICEVLVSNIAVEKLVTRLYADCINLAEHPVAVEGLFTLIRCCSPTFKLIDTIISLPAEFERFSAAVLISWLSSNETTLMLCLVEWLEKKHQFPVSSKGTVKLNGSAFEVLLKYFDEQGRKNDGSAHINISEIKEKLSHLIKDKR